MQCRYINLDHATEHRAALEASFEKASRPGWSLSRFKAIDTAEVDARLIRGARSSAEKGCFLSHKSVIEAHAGGAGHLLVLEDDVEFGSATFEIIDGFLQNNPDAEWDLLFLDVCVIGIEDLLKMYFNRRDLINKRNVMPLDLAKIGFFGTNAYIVNAGSVGKLVSVLEAGFPVDIEYDIYLSHQIARQQLKAAVLFPFVTTLSRHATQSQIQVSRMDKLNLVRNLLRNLLWLESRPDEVTAALVEFDAMNKASEHQTFFTLLLALLSSFEELKAPVTPANFNQSA